MDFSEKLMDLKSLEMAKKRDHKIMITEEAIEKVPFIRYKEIPEEEYPIIHMLAKKVLQLSRDENESNEVAITYSMDNSLVDVRFFLEHPTVKLLTVVTNLGNIFYLVKSKAFNIDRAIDIFNEAVSANNEAVGLKALQNASEYFLKNCHKAGIIYEDR